ncbi:BrnA antitoxin family protein [Duganella sp. LX20W]|uniref:BrnA antitoxin family protein n=1 Tax=Rugamonas brunnea TaxID=2758569 RepID=A0A7W2EW33_9BURK|nr:BrnA antitoxin family protein [Rugamonas brunnea]MBA5639698.1 BrnA antitoxin family protein [Rugamonas brunnea]
MHKQYDFSEGKRGAVLSSTGKTRITIMLDEEILEYFRKYAEAQGSGYQTMINAALRQFIFDQSKPANQPVTEETLRRVLREELHTS